jgi:hypothetical protein
VVAMRDGLCVVPEPLAIFNIYPNSYFHRTRGDAKSYREILEKILNLLAQPEYHDVRQLMLEAGSLHIYGAPMLRLMLSRPDYRTSVNLRFVFKALWHSTKLTVKAIIPKPLGNLYFRLAGYRAPSR